MESKHLVVEAMGESFVKVYWSNKPEDIIWAGLRDTWEESLESLKAEKPSAYPLDWLYGVDIVYK